MVGGFRELGVGLIAVTAPVIYPFFRPAFWARGPYLPADRRRQLQFLRHPPPRPRGDEDDDNADGGGDGGPFGYGKPGVHDTAIELQGVDEQMTAFAPPDDDDGGDSNKEEEGRAWPRGSRWRSLSSSTTIVASEAGCSRQASRGHGEDGPAARAGGTRPGTSGSANETVIEETDWALQYLSK